MIYIDLILNLTLLVALSVISGFIEKSWDRQTRLGLLLQGVLFGCAALIGMLRPVDLGPGLIFDGRSVMLSLCALFYGPWAAFVSAAITVSYRIGLGGAGAVMGVLVILSSAGIGLLGRYRLRPNTNPPSTESLYLLGLAVHLAMVALMFTLPGNMALTVIKRVGLPVILLYPLATILAGKILSDQVSALRTLANLQAAKRNLATTLHSIGDAVISTNLRGEVVFMNPVAETLTGWSATEALGKPLGEVFHIINEKTREKVEDPVSQVLIDGKVVGLANHTLLISKSGIEHPIADSAAPICDAGDQITGVVMVFRDQSEERRVQKLMQTRLALLDYATSHSLEDLMRKALDETCTLVDSPIGFYHFVEADQKTLSLQQWSTRTLREFCKTEGKGMHYSVDQAGIWVDCVHQRKPVLHNDYASVPHRKGLPDGHAPLVRELVVPIVRGVKVVAILGVGNKPADYTEKDVETVSYLADVTWHAVEQKRAEEELRRNEVLYRKLFEESPFSIALNRPTGEYVDVNQKFCRYSGLAYEEVIGKTPVELGLVDADTNEAMINAMQENSGVLDGYEMAMPDSEGSLTHLLVYASVINTQEESLLLSITNNITERKQAEYALGESEEKLGSILSVAPIGIGLVADRVILRANDHLCAMTGYSEDELLGKKARMLYPTEEDYEEVGREKYRQIADEGTGTVETKWRRKDGSLIDVLLSSAPLRRDDLSAGVTFTALDITERKRAEEALRDSEERLRLFVEHAPAILAMFDRNMCYVSVSRKWLNEYNLGQRDIIGLCHYDVFPKIPERWRQVHRRSMAGEVVRAEEDRVERSTGSYQWLRWETRPWHDASGRIGGVVIFVEDITERKIAEEERGKLQLQLIQAQKMESVGRLAGGVAHDFNNMLGVIMGHTELALYEIGSTQSAYRNLQEVLKAAHRSADLVRQLLAFARKQTICPRVLNINETVESMLKMVRRLIGEDIELVWKPGADIWTVKVDPTQIDQILANLCVNARDAIAGGGEIIIETRKIALDEAYCREHAGSIPGDYMMLAVRDNGCGMDKETIGKVFEPFFTTKEVGKGTGLGLATVYGIVNQNSGFIDIESEPGQGTTFRIYLPRTDVPAGDKQSVELQKKDLTGNETVLLVEDEESILALGKTILERHGYTVLASQSPGEALRMAQDHPSPIHLLVTDVVMPVMNGKDLREKLHALKPGLKCIFMSGYTADIIADQGVLDEGIDFLQKPFSVETLTGKVRETLDG